MGQQVSVETFASSTDTDGNKYWTSFDPYPFKVGSKKLVFMGILNGDGPLKGQKCVVKTIRNGSISRQDWVLQSKRAQIARDMANCYNKVISRQNRKITFNCPVTAEIDTMSDCLCINDILGKPKKKWNNAEHVSIELYLRGKYEDFEYGWVPPADLLEPEAFSHFTWCRSEGTMLVSNLQGVKTSCAYHFTSPVIHSEDQKFGASDLGPKGIKGFFQLHKCNQICNQWPVLGDGVDLRGWGEYITMGQRCPTAPPLSMELQFAPPPYVENDSNCVPYSMDDPRSFERQSLPLTRANPANDDAERRGYHDRAQTELQPRNFSPVPFQRQNNGGNLWNTPYQQTVRQQRAAQWQLTGNQGFVIDWREEFINQRMTFDPQFDQDNPMMQNEVLTMQLMWIVKQLSYTAITPPPEYNRFEPAPGRMITQQSDFSRNWEPDISRSWEPEKQCLSDDEDDMNYLLPPPYSEASVDPELECVTYL